jgi:hypothetical protein
MSPWWVADKPVSSLRKLIVMLYSGGAGFRREFLEVNEIERHYITPVIRASPTNERILLANPGISFHCTIKEFLVASTKRNITT